MRREKYKVLFNEMVWFVKEHPIGCAIVLFFVAIYLYIARIDKRNYENRVDYKSGWWERRQKRNYQETKDTYMLIAVVAIVVIVVAYNLFCK